LKNISTPSSPQYGHYLDREEVNTLFPIADAIPIIGWLENFNITLASQTGSVLIFTPKLEQPTNC
jgi:tripeptidyl-peptidase-1